MNNLNETSDRYRQVQVETASTVDLVVLAYEALIRNLYQALESLEEGPNSYDVFSDKLTRCQEIVSALDDGIDDSQGELSTMLTDLYQFVRSNLIESNLNKDAEGVQTLISTLEQVKGYWEDSNRFSQTEVAREDLSEEKEKIDFAT